MSAVELVEFGLKDDAVDHRAAIYPFIPYAKSAIGVGPTIDVSGHTALRLDLDARVNQGAAPEAVLRFEHAATSDGPWEVLLEKTFTHQSWPPIGTRVLLDGFDRYLRCSWTVKAYAAAGALDFKLGISGDGLPDAA